MLKSRVGRAARGSCSGDFFVGWDIGCGGGAGTDEAGAGDGFSVAPVRLTPSMRKVRA